MDKRAASLLRLRQAMKEPMLKASRKLNAKDAIVRAALVSGQERPESILKKLKKQHISSCFVVDKDKRLLGQISEKDIIRLFLMQVKKEPLVKKLNLGYRREFLHMHAKDLVKRKGDHVLIDTPINKVIRKLALEHDDCVAVLDHEKRVVGAITPSSIIRLLEKQ